MRYFKFIFIAVIPFLLTGCWDKIELEERGFVVTLGVDKYDKKDDDTAGFTGNEENDRYLISMEFPNLSEVSQNMGGMDSGGGKEGESGGGGSGKIVKKAKSETVSGAMRVIDTYSSQRLYYGHTKVGIIGQELLNDPVLFKEALDALERDREISRKIILLATKGKADNILKSPSSTRPLIGIFVNDFYKNNNKNVGVTFRQDMEYVIQDMLSGDTTIIPEIEIENEEPKIGGLAVIKNYKLVGWLNDMQTRGYLWVNDDNMGGDLSVDFDGSFVPLKINSKKTKIDFEQNDNKIICSINVDVIGNVEEYKLEQNVLLDSSVFAELQEKFEAAIVKEISDTVNILQNDFKTDAFGFREHCRKNYPDIYNNYKDNWETAFTNMDFNINADVSVKSSGSIK